LILFFADTTTGQATEQQVKEMKEFVEKHASQLIEIKEMLEETLTDTWDSHSDLIALWFQPYEQTNVVELIRTENKLYNKVTMVFASLCNEVAILQEIVSGSLFSLLYHFQLSHFVI
jgi:WASH complex subunit 7